MLRRVLIVIAVVILGGVLFVGLTDGYGADSGEAALPIAGVRATGGFGGFVQLEVECADHIRVEVRPDPAGSGLPQITVWGRPRIGRCMPREASVSVVQLAGAAHERGEPPPTKFVDGATSQVVSLRTDS